MSTTPSSSLRTVVKHALFDNFALKLVSLLCAIGFFTFIHGSERAQRPFPVPVVRIPPPESANRILVRELPTEIMVTLSGPRTQLDSLTPSDLGTITLDVSTGRESTIEIKPSMIPDVPPGLTVEQIFPSTINVKWDDVVAKQLPVQVARTGEPIEGFSVRGDIATKPETVETRGPRTIVDLMQVARAAPFDVSGLGEGYHPRTLQLDPPPNQVTYTPDTVQAIVQIVREERVMPFKGVKVEIVGNPKATTKPASVTVKVRGAPDQVSAIDADSIVPRVTMPTDADLSKPGSAMVPVVVDVADVEIEIDPPLVLIKW